MARLVLLSMAVAKGSKAENEDAPAKAGASCLVLAFTLTKMALPSINRCSLPRQDSLDITCYAQKAITFHMELSPEFVQNTRYEMQALYSMKNLSSRYIFVPAA